ncbi:hypothetical protein AJ87_13955 [Rhizobium yanglingense]|nr:hypothetical protein AJ87_13955 [Rhizobium yanglingense]
MAPSTSTQPRAERKYSAQSGRRGKPKRRRWRRELMMLAMMARQAMTPTIQLQWRRSSRPCRRP